MFRSCSLSLLVISLFAGQLAAQNRDSNFRVRAATASFQDIQPEDTLPPVEVRPPAGNETTNVARDSERPKRAPTRVRLRPCSGPPRSMPTSRHERRMVVSESRRKVATRTGLDRVTTSAVVRQNSSPSPTETVAIRGILDSRVEGRYSRIG